MPLSKIILPKVELGFFKPICYKMSSLIIYSITWIKFSRFSLGFSTQTCDEDMENPSYFNFKSQYRANVKFGMTITAFKPSF
jgi:hypothetical protein